MAVRLTTWLIAPLLSKDHNAVRGMEYTRILAHALTITTASLCLIVAGIVMLVAQNLVVLCTLMALFLCCAVALATSAILESSVFFRKFGARGGAGGYLGSKRDDDVLPLRSVGVVSDADGGAGGGDIELTTTTTTSAAVTSGFEGDGGIAPLDTSASAAAAAASAASVLSSDSAKQP